MKTNKSNDCPGPLAPEPCGGDGAAVSPDVYSSYVFSASGRSISKYGERLLMQVISVAQEYISDVALCQNRLNFDEVYKSKFAVIDIPIKSLLNVDDTTNYSNAKQAAVDLMKIYHTVETPVLDDEGKPVCYGDGKPQYQFESFHLLDRVTVNKEPGMVSVRLGEDTWSHILDMGKGYTRYSLVQARLLNNVTAIRLFQLLSNATEPLRFGYDRLRAVFGLQDSYVDNPHGFVKKVIEPAVREINAKCSFSVAHEFYYADSVKAGRRPVAGIVFTKTVRAADAEETLIAPELYRYLVSNFGFDRKGIRTNLALFNDLVKGNHDIIGFLESIRGRITSASNPQGYVITSLRNLVRNVAMAPGLYDGQEQAASVVSEAPVKRGRGAGKGSGRLKVSGADAFRDMGMEEI